MAEFWGVANKWRAFKNEFDALAQRQTDLKDEGGRRDRLLRAYCSYGPEHPVLGYIRLEGGTNQRITSEFGDIGTRASIALGCPPTVKPVEFWVHSLCQDLIRRDSSELFAGSADGGIIQDLIASSASYCLRLATSAEESAHQNRTEGGSVNAGSPGVTSGSPRLPVLPEGFQSAFEGAKAAAELEYAAQPDAHHPQAYGALQSKQLRLPILIQTVFFAYCDQARAACREGAWIVRETRENAEAAESIICDFYLIREGLPAAAIAKLKQDYLEGIRLDSRWAEHLTDLKALAGNSYKPAPGKSVHSQGSDDWEDPPFRQGADRYPYLYAQWTESTRQWTFRDCPGDVHGKPDYPRAVVAGEQAIGLLNQGSRFALRRLRLSLDQQVREVARTLRDPLLVWLDMMRANQRGFRFTPQLTRWRGGKAMEEFQRTGVPPSDARITGNGTIMRLFHESAAFWDDLVHVGFDVEDASTERREPVTPDHGQVNEIATKNAPAVAETGPGPDDVKSKDADRSEIRSAWLDRKLAEHGEWTSDTDIEANGGPVYNTIQRYRSGVESTRDLYVRRQLAKAFKCETAEVPE